MEIVLGVSMAPTTVRLVLVEGEDADGATVEEDCIAVEAAAGLPGQVIGAVLGTREAAYEGGYRLSSTGVTWTDPSEVGALRDALDARDIRGVMLVAPLLAAAALTQTVGHALGYAYTALLFVETGSATLAVVDTADGAIVDLHRQLVPCSPYGAQAASDLAAMIQRLDGFQTRADGVFIVGCGVDIIPIKQHLEAAAPLPVSVPEEPAMALARGAALASANAPLFASSTAALAYAQDPGTGEVKRRTPAPAYLNVDPGANVASGALAYSAVPDENVARRRRHRPLLLVGSGAAAVLVIAIVALVITLAGDLRPTADQRPNQGANAVAPTKQAPPSTHAPVVAAPAVPPAAPPPVAVPPPAPAPPPETITAPAPVVRQSPQRANPAPAQQTPRQAPPAYVPPAPQQAPPPEAPPPPPPAAPAPPPPPQMPPMTMYLHLPFVTVPIPINPPPPPPPPPGP